jgi:hypothetical protein
MRSGNSSPTTSLVVQRGSHRSFATDARPDYRAVAARRVAISARIAFRFG